LRPGSGADDALYSLLERRLARLLDQGGRDILAGGLVGLEKESLRVSPAGGIAQTPHPRALGAALTHPSITTDFSEALSELITPAFPSGGAALASLAELHQFVYRHLGDELLWATSMPCALGQDATIPIARYGDSNRGRMKTVYRLGLSYRYGRRMQVIAGVHFNYSPPQGLWPVYQACEGRPGPLRPFTDAAFMGMIRNLQRYGWLVPYLFGAAPAVCRSFLGGRPSSLEAFDAGTLYEPFGTSLRMGDIGYANKKEKGYGIQVCYDDLEGYIATIRRATETPCEDWERIGVQVDGEYRQLNANLLQIENEYYSTVRPKQVPKTLEKPAQALQRRGIHYVELRSPDVNVFDPLGISEGQVRFLEALMLFCLLQESPPIDDAERAAIDLNIGDVAHSGRTPGMSLLRRGSWLPLRQWGEELCDAMTDICAVLDGSDPARPYTRVLAEQRELLHDPDRTPSARMLAEMRQQRESFFEFAHRMSHQHRDWFRQQPLAEETAQRLQTLAEASWQEQQRIEAEPQVPFDQFLSAYFS
jgi:glutamate--cysteine ligase